MHRFFQATDTGLNHSASQVTCKTKLPFLRRQAYLESSGAVSFSEMKPACAEHETSQVTYVGEGYCSGVSRVSVKNDRKDTEADGAAHDSRTSCWPCDDPIFIAPSWFSARHRLALSTGAGPDWRNELFREGDIERHPGPQRALPSRWTHCPLLRNTVTWPFQNLKNT